MVSWHPARRWPGRSRQCCVATDYKGGGWCVLPLTGLLSRLEPRSGPRGPGLRPVRAGGHYLRIPTGTLFTAPGQAADHGPHGHNRAPTGDRQPRSLRSWHGLDERERRADEREALADDREARAIQRDSEAGLNSASSWSGERPCASRLLPRSLPPPTLRRKSPASMTSWLPSGPPALISTGASPSKHAPTPPAHTKSCDGSTRRTDRSSGTPQIRAIRHAADHACLPRARRQAGAAASTSRHYAGRQPGVSGPMLPVVTVVCKGTIDAFVPLSPRAHRYSLRRPSAARPRCGQPGVRPPEPGPRHEREGDAIVAQVVWPSCEW